MKTSYYKTVYRRHNIIGEALLNFFLAMSSWPRMLLEVPIRRQFGERYFNFATVITILVILGVVPFMIIAEIRYFHGGTTTGLLSQKFITWYAYLAWFLYAAIQRRDEIKRAPSTFDFGRFSLSTGLVDRRFFNIEWNGRRPDIRTVETVIEPGVFFFIGFVLWIIGQPIGFVLFASSIFYSFSYVAAYNAGENFLLDKIDEQICNEELVRTFVEDVSPDQARGFNFYGRRPADPDARQRLADMFVHENDSAEVL